MDRSGPADSGVHDRVDQLAPAAGALDPFEALADRAGDHAVGVDRDAEDLGTVPANVVERARKRRRLDDHRIARVDERGTPGTGCADPFAMKIFSGVTSRFS